MLLLRLVWSGWSLGIKAQTNFKFANASANTLLPSIVILHHNFSLPKHTFLTHFFVPFAVHICFDLYWQTPKWWRQPTALLSKPTRWQLTEEGGTAEMYLTKTLPLSAGEVHYTRIHFLRSSRVNSEFPSQSLKGIVDPPSRHSHHIYMFVVLGDRQR